MKTLRVTAVAATAALVLAGCATVQTPSKQDPFEGFNRTVFQFNDTLDRVALKPAAQAYNRALPQFLRDRVSSFFSNIGDVYTAANNLLQGKITAGTQDIMRVAMNSTFGLGGLFDFASQARLPKHQSDFGITLGHYGVPAGPYLVLPLLGPSTVRDTAGLLVDWQGDLTMYMRPIWLRTTLYGVRIISTRASLLGATDLLASAALDKYSFVRNAYLQRRQYLISDGNPPPPSYDDESGADTGPTDMTEPAAGTAAGAGAGAGCCGCCGCCGCRRGSRRPGRARRRTAARRRGRAGLGRGCATAGAGRGRGAAGIGCGRTGAGRIDAGRGERAGCRRGRREPAGGRQHGPTGVRPGRIDGAGPADDPARTLLQFPESSPQMKEFVKS